MKKSNALLIALTMLSVTLIGAIVIDNIVSVPALDPTVMSSRENDTSTAIRQGFMQKGLSLHPGQYWKVSHE